MTDRKPTPQEIWAEPEPDAEMVYAVCPYTRRGDTCRRCEPIFKDDAGEDCIPGCYAWAAEACRVVGAMQNQEN